jgi:hypothetical protein
MKFIFSIVLLTAVLFSCDHPKITGIVTSSTAIFDDLNSNDTIRIVPTGTVLEFVDKAVLNNANTPMSKVRLNGKDGYIDRKFIVFAVRPGMMKTFVNYPDGSHFPENGFVVYDSIENDQAHIYYEESSNSAWVSTEDVDLDTANAAVAALVHALDAGLYDDEARSTLTRVAASHATHPLLHILNVDLSEAPDKEVGRMQKNYKLLLNKSENQAIVSSEAAGLLMKNYVNDIFALPPDGQEADEYNSPRLKYFYNYVCALPDFVKVVPKSVAATTSKDSDPLKSYLLYRLDRSPENIKRLYDAFKPAIVELLTSGYIQDVRPDMVALITVYDRIVAMPNHRAVLGGISKKIGEWDKENTDENGINHSMYTLVDQATIYEPIIDTEKYDPRNDGKGIWYSSFWTRRFAEGNEKVVYDILKELVSAWPADPEDESNETELITCTFQDYTVGDCGHVIFTCGDYGDADVNALPEDELKMWNDLMVDDETNGPSGNEKYIGKEFRIRIGTTTGPACNEGQGGEGRIPKILEFKLVLN